MTEEQIIKAGFKRTDVSAEEAEGQPFYYYTYYIGSICLISEANDLVKNGDWKINIFESEGFEINNIDQLKRLMDILKEINKD